MDATTDTSEKVRLPDGTGCVSGRMDARSSRRSATLVAAAVSCAKESIAVLEAANHGLAGRPHGERAR